MKKPLKWPATFKKSTWPATFNFKKLFTWLDKNFLFLGVAFLLFFIPLYPKLPLLDIRHTWVYIRLEDVLIALLAGFWLLQLVRRKLSLKTPLTFPILVYWLVGGASLLHLLLILGPHLAVFYPSVAVLHYLRRLEYMVLFFIAFTTIKDSKQIKKLVLIAAITLFLVCLYGLGQKFANFPAFLTMNEEFAKGIPLFLPPEARVTSTFAGHYDLGAFLVFMIALFGSLVFVYPQLKVKIFILLLILLSFFVLLLTASRVSFIVYLAAVSLMLWLQKKKRLIVPVVVVSFLLMSWLSGASQRFGKTLRVERVVYEAKTGKAIAVLEETEDIGKIITEEEEIAQESLPLGSGYLPVPVIESKPPEATQVAVIKKPIFSTLKTASRASEIATISGEFLIKRAIVYDVSFTTRFQGEWPRALEAFRRNFLLGSGFSSISLATDNDYLRLLGETGLLGFFSFLSIFLIFGLLVKQFLKKEKNSFNRSVLIGVFAGLVGLMLNAFLIDVFEASKVAYTLWLWLGISLALIKLSRKKGQSLLKEFLEVAGHPLAITFILIGVGFLVFSPGLKSYFIGDDFTWLRWALTSSKVDLANYFLKAEGFFYRPLAKLYFFFAVPLFGIKPQGYHLVSLLLHLGTTILAYFIVLVLSKKRFFSALVALLFLIHPVNAESVFWISTTSHLLASFFYLGGFLAYLGFRKFAFKPSWLALVLTLLFFILGLTSHERMVTFPLILIAYDLIFTRFTQKKNWLKKTVPYLPFFVIWGIYLWLRNSVAQAHGLSGDYNYNLANLPFNFLGNFLGYGGELLVGFSFIPFYDWLRAWTRTHKGFSLAVLLSLLGFLILALKRFGFKKLNFLKNFRLIVFALAWAIILLLPFLGLGNLAERYVYPAHLGFFIILSLVIDWLYRKLASYKPRLALLVLLTIVLGLSSFYLFDLSKIAENWYQAGEISNKTLLTLASNFTSFEENNNLYFVNLPIRYHRAWVFPVGLEDALWLVYRDDLMKVYRENDLETALDSAAQRSYSHVFVYEEGELKKALR